MRLKAFRASSNFKRVFLFCFSYIKRKSVKILFVAGVYDPILFKTLRRLKLICRAGDLPSALFPSFPPLVKTAVGATANEGFVLHKTRLER